LQNEVSLSFKPSVLYKSGNMFGTMMESFGMMGYTERTPPIDAPTPAATSAAYARALEGATASTKADIAQFYPKRKEIPHSSICANQLEVIEATLPQQQHCDEHELEDTRDQHIQNNGERLTTETYRDGIQQFFAPKSYKLTTGHTVHTIPDKLITGHTVHSVSMNKIASPKQSVQQEEDENRIFSHDIEAKHLLESILRLDTDITEAAGVVYHYFLTKTVDDKVSPSGRAIEVIHSIKDELRKGNSKPAYQFLETAKSVLPILKEEREAAGLELEANIFSEDSEDSVSSFPKNAYSQHDEMRSISDQTAAIFQFLDDAKSFGTGEREIQSEDPVGSKISGTRDSKGNIFRILEENEVVPSLTPDGIYLAQPQERFPGIVEDPTDVEDPSNFNAPNVDDMDLEFVENFDLAYSEFLFYHPKLVAKNPELMKNLRIYKLQKLLEYNDILERTNSGKLNAMIEEKNSIEELMHLKLKDAVRKKAAHQTFLQSEVNDINWNTKQVQAKLRWKVLKYSEDRAKRQSKLREQFQQIPQVKTRQDLIRLIPEGPHSKKLEIAIKSSFIAEGSSKPDVLSSNKEVQLRNFQVENSVVNSELLMLNQKLAHLRKEAQKLEWVQSTVMELDPATMYNFKKKFEKKEGVTL